jgi:hypothetical protein
MLANGVHEDPDTLLFNSIGLNALYADLDAIDGTLNVTNDKNFELSRINVIADAELIGYLFSMK